MNMMKKLSVKQVSPTHARTGETCCLSYPLASIPLRLSLPFAYSPTTKSTRTTRNGPRVLMMSVLMKFIRIRQSRGRRAGKLMLSRPG